MNNLNRTAKPGTYLVNCDGCGDVYYHNHVSKDQYGLYMCQVCIDPPLRPKKNCPPRKPVLVAQPIPPYQFRAITDPSGQYDEDSADIPLNE